MDIKQQTKNVAAQGRFGDSMLLHVNPAEVKGLASSMPITINPETGQPEAFLPFLAPMLGSLLGSTFLTGAGAGALGGLIGAKGLSAAAAAGIGAGLATYAQTGGSGSKALLSGLTAGLGTKALGTQAQAVDPSIVARDTGAAESLKTIFTQPEVVASEGVKAANPFDLGVKSLGSAAMTPSGMAAATTAGTGAVIQSQEEFEREMAQLAEDEEERKKRMYEMYPEQIPVASGGKIGFQRGRNTYDPRYDPRESIDFNPNLGNNLTGQYQLPARRIARPIPRGFMPGFQPEFSYFESINPTATGLGFGQTAADTDIGFDVFPSARRGRGFFGGRPRLPLPRPIQPPIGGGFFGRRRPPMFAGYGNPFMQSPTYQGFYGAPQMQQMLNPYARFVQQPMPFPGFYGRPTPPPFMGGPGYGPQPDPVPDPTPPVVDPVPTPPITGPTPPKKGGPTPIEPIEPPDDFVKPEPIPLPPRPPDGRPVELPRPPYRPPYRPEPEPIDIPMPIRPRPEPIEPEPIDIVNPVPPKFFPPGFVKPPFRGRPIKPPSIGGPGGGNFISEPEPVAPPPNITIPIEGGADVTIPDFTRPQPPRELSAFAEPSYTTGTSELMDRMFPSGRPGPIAPPNMPVNKGPRPINVQPQLPQTGGIFGAPMFEDGGDTNVEVDKLPEGLKAMYDSGPKGREGVEKIAAKTDKFQEGGPTGDMMQDPIVQETIQFILGETDNSDVVNEFIVKYGQEQFMMLRNMILAQAAGNSDVQTEGLIQGTGRSGMADDLPMNIGDKPIAAVSQDEYIIPADVVSMLGDGSSDAGSKQLDSMLDRIRMTKTGNKTQAKPINPNKVLPA